MAKLIIDNFYRGVGAGEYSNTANTCSEAINSRRQQKTRQNNAVEPIEKA